MWISASHRGKITQLSAKIQIFSSCISSQFCSCHSTSVKLLYSVCLLHSVSLTVCMLTQSSLSTLSAQMSRLHERWGNLRALKIRGRAIVSSTTDTKYILSSLNCTFFCRLIFPFFLRLPVCAYGSVGFEYSALIPRPFPYVPEAPNSPNTLAYACMRGSRCLVSVFDLGINHASLCSHFQKKVL
uniref:Uncharacterized protein n=1 Tax=Amphiprion percula TaxID=161767 RepID=A0A3P8SK83_AMPPE